MVLVDGFSVVSPLLFIPPVGMRVAELPLDPGRVDVAAILCEKVSPLLGAGSVHLHPRGPYHLRVFLLGQAWVIGVFLVHDAALAGNRIGEESSLLDERKTARRLDGQAEGRCPHHPSKKHLESCEPDRRGTPRSAIGVW